MNWFKETGLLIKWLFNSKPSDFNKVQIVQMNHYPWKGYLAMSWCGRIITRKDPSEITEKTITHETIHLKQAQLKKKWYKYYLTYIWEWIKGNPIIHPSQSAYYTIPYEVEAYANENNPEYVTNYDGSNLHKYTLKDRKKIYRQNRFNWKEFIKTL